MFALLAVVVFMLATFGVHLGSIALVPLGLAFLAAHFVVPVVTPYVRRRSE